MAHGRPWYQRAGGNLLLAVMHFPDTDHRWGYSAVIDMLNDRDRPIPDDAAFICGFTGLSRKKWATVRRYLLENRGSNGEFYLQLTDAGDITNPRFQREHEAREAARQASVEGGKLGGKRSAEARRAAQPALPLDEPEGPKVARKSADKRPESTPESPPITPAKVGTALNENNDLTEAPPQGIARALEKREERREEDSSPASNPDQRGTSDGDAADLIGKEALLTIVRKLSRTGGTPLNPSRPQAFVREVDQVRQWINDGIDPDRTMIPAIAARVARMGEDDTAGSLKLFDGDVRKAHARTEAGKAGLTGKAVTTDQLKTNATTTAALYRKLGRHTEADQIEKQAGVGKAHNPEGEPE